MESTQKKSRLGHAGGTLLRDIWRISRFALVVLLIIVVIFAVRYAWNNVSERETRISTTVNLDTLRAVTKLVIWEQEFSINDIQTENKKYFGTDLLSFSESVATTAQGRMLFYIDLSNEAQTEIVNTDGGVIIRTPLQVDRPNIYLSSIKQIKDRSLDPTLEVDQEAIRQRLDTIAYIQNLPTMIGALRRRSLAGQESNLKNLVGKRVRIILTDDPPVMNIIHNVKN